MMNRKLLRGKIAENEISQSELAKKIGISSQSLSRKLTGQREFKLSEVMRLCDALKIDDPVQIFLR